MRRFFYNSQLKLNVIKAYNIIVHLNTYLVEFFENVQCD